MKKWNMWEISSNQHLFKELHDLQRSVLGNVFYGGFKGLFQECPITTYTLIIWNLIPIHGYSKWTCSLEKTFY